MAGVSAGMGVMTSLLGKLSALLGDEYKVLKGVRKEVEFLKRELSTMNALLVTLADAEKLGPLAKDWRNKVRELSYDLEDCIDVFMYRLGSGKAKGRFMRKTMGRLKALWARHEIASQIQDLKARVEEESKRRQRYRLDGIISKPGTMNIDPRLPVLFAEAKGLVAVDGPRDKIIRLLMDGKEELKVVSVVGCGGLGKRLLLWKCITKLEENFSVKLRCQCHAPSI
uniref:Uncharacterized protein n=1 Tax=Avena sativa TaxID=4498 RepID=A0ACD5WU05_AVESA